MNLQGIMPNGENQSQKGYIRYDAIMRHVWNGNILEIEDWLMVVRN